MHHLTASRFRESELMGRRTTHEVTVYTVFTLVYKHSCDIAHCISNDNVYVYRTYK